MYSDELFTIWAPPASIWSPWAKPVLFAAEPTYEPLPAGLARADSYALAALAEPWKSNTALIVDLPGDKSVHAGLTLARQGYRPVPLYNLCGGSGEVVRTGPILRALADAAPRLQQIQLPDDAPPAFLLDSDRLAPGQVVNPGKFDNRWVVFPQDFPSATFLQSRRVARVLILTLKHGNIYTDLRYVLQPWQKADLELATCDPSVSMQPQPLNLNSLRSLVPMMWQRMFMFFRFELRSNYRGGFGAVVPKPSSSGG